MTKKPQQQQQQLLSAADALLLIEDLLDEARTTGETCIHASALYGLQDAIISVVEKYATRTTIHHQLAPVELDDVPMPAAHLVKDMIDFIARLNELCCGVDSDIVISGLMNVTAMAMVQHNSTLPEADQHAVEVGAILRQAIAVNWANKLTPKLNS